MKENTASNRHMAGRTPDMIQIQTPTMRDSCSPVHFPRRSAPFVAPTTMLSFSAAGRSRCHGWVTISIPSDKGTPSLATSLCTYMPVRMWMCLEMEARSLARYSLVSGPGTASVVVM